MAGDVEDMGNIITEIMVGKHVLLAHMNGGA